MARDDEPYAVPVAPLGGGRGQVRRARAVAAALVLVVGGAFAVARMPDRVGGPAHGDASPSPGLIGVAPSPSLAPSQAGLPLAPPRVERLIDAPNQVLAGAPMVRLVELNGTDITLVDWTAGGGMQRGRTFPGAIPDPLSTAFAVVAPTGDRILLLHPDADKSSSSTGRLIDTSGRVIWTASGLFLESGALWSPDGSMVVTVGPGRRWHIVAIAEDGKATDTTIRLPGEVFLPTPAFGSMSTPPRTAAIGFSADGRWIYGGIVSPHVGTLIGGFRVRRDGSDPEGVLTYRVGERDGLLPVPGSIAGRVVDPVLGRLANWRSNTDIAGGPPTVEVREPDSSFLFNVEVGNPLGSGWDAAGDLYVLSADSPLYMNRVALERIGLHGEPIDTLLETGPVFLAYFVGIRDGYAAIALLTRTPSERSQVVLIDLERPDRIAAIPMELGPDPQIIGAELVSAGVATLDAGTSDPP